MSWDVIISGAGIIGVSLALELRQRGAQVLVLDSGVPGQEASTAAAGMLAAGDPETPQKLRSLARESAGMYPAFVEKLEAASGISTDFRLGSVVLFERAESLPDHNPISLAELKQLEPAIDANGHPSYLVASENSIDPALLMQAALRTARAAGVEVRGQTAVQGMHSNGGQVETITSKGGLFSKAAVNCQGAWAGAPIRPRKGQMIYLQPKNPALLQRVVRAPAVYLVPRSSGKILAGATVEDVGYDKGVAPEVVKNLHRAAVQIVPQLADAPILAGWAGLRPGTPDDLPILGQLDSDNLFIAGGHFRNGILLAPITAKIMADLIAGQTPPLDISAFSPARFGRFATS